MCVCALVRAREKVEHGRDVLDVRARVCAVRLARRVEMGLRLALPNPQVVHVVGASRLVHDLLRLALFFRLFPRRLGRAHLLQQLDGLVDEQLFQAQRQARANEFEFGGYLNPDRFSQLSARFRRDAGDDIVKYSWLTVNQFPRRLPERLPWLPRR